MSSSASSLLAVGIAPRMIFSRSHRLTAAGSHSLRGVLALGVGQYLSACRRYRSHFLCSEQTQLSRDTYKPGCRSLRCGLVRAERHRAREPPRRRAEVERPTGACASALPSEFCSLGGGRADAGRGAFFHRDQGDYRERGVGCNECEGPEDVVGALRTCGACALF